MVWCLVYFTLWCWVIEKTGLPGWNVPNEED